MNAKRARARRNDGGTSLTAKKKQTEVLQTPSSLPPRPTTIVSSSSLAPRSPFFQHPVRFYRRPVRHGGRRRPSSHNAGIPGQVLRGLPPARADAGTSRRAGPRGGGVHRGENGRRSSNTSNEGGGFGRYPSSLCLPGGTLNLTISMHRRRRYLLQSLPPSTRAPGARRAHNTQTHYPPRHASASVQKARRK